uniref:(northern house mosquito) hypothetical protein n=1 Tax=Culex pipiens TaxID=7175 RepID=A0A8D8KL86_CULPI
MIACSRLPSAIQPMNKTLRLFRRFQFNVDRYCEEPVSVRVCLSRTTYLNTAGTEERTSVSLQGKTPLSKVDDHRYFRFHAMTGCLRSFLHLHDFNTFSPQSRQLCCFPSAFRRVSLVNKNITAPACCERASELATLQPPSDPNKAKLSVWFWSRLRGRKVTISRAKRAPIRPNCVTKRAVSE